MNELLQALQAADRICRQANPYYENASALERQCAEQVEKQKKAKKKWIIIGIVVWVLGSSVLGAVLSVIPVLGAAASLGSIALGIFVGLSGFKKETEETETFVAKLQSQIQKEKAAAQQIFDRHIDDLAFLPVDYWYPMATEYMIKAVRAKRATTLGEAIDKFEEQLHRWKIEETNAQMVNLQQQQTAHLASIKTSSKVSAAANVANTMFNIASRL